MEFVTNITDADIKQHRGATISLTATYTISVYATKTDYENSDVATATLCWIGKEPQKDGIANSVMNIPSRALLIQNDGSQLTVEGADDGTLVSVYTTDGKLVGSAVSRNGAANVSTTLCPGSVAIVKVGEKAVKILSAFCR